MSVWCYTDLIKLHCFFGLVTTEKMYLKEIRRMKVQNPLPWIMNEHSDATTHFLRTNDGKYSALVALRVKPHMHLPGIAGLLSHEAVHIWQAFIEHIGEVKPSKEFEAYSIQTITQRLLEAYMNQTGGTMDDKEIIDIARTKDGGEWNAIDPVICKKLVQFARSIAKRVRARNGEKVSAVPEVNRPSREVLAESMPKQEGANGGTKRR